MPVWTCKICDAVCIISFRNGKTKLQHKIAEDTLHTSDSGAGYAIAGRAFTDALAEISSRGVESHT
jgi:hypothetical protein